MPESYMHMSFFRSAAASGIILFAINGLAAQENTQSPLANSGITGGDASVQGQTVVREANLAELGFVGGLELEGLTGSRDLFFAVPAASSINSLRLRLPFRSDSAFESRRSLRLKSGGQTLLTRSLPSSPFEDVIDLPIDPALAANGFLNIKLEYAGAISDDRCVDQRISGAYLRLDQSGGLIADLRPEAVDQINKIASLMPSRAQIVLPEGADQTQAAAALTLALNRSNARIVSGQGGAAPTGANWNSTQISFASEQSPAIVVEWVNGTPEFRIGGSDPIATARFLRSNWSTAVGAPSAIQASQTGGEPPESITFADLGSDTSIQSISGRGNWNTVIPLAALPTGTKLDGAVIETLVSDDGGVTQPIVTVLLNGLLLASAEARYDEPTRINVDFPAGSVSTVNDLEVSITRQVSSGDCRFEPQGYPAQLLQSSMLKLGNADGVDDFLDLPSAFNGGFTVVARTAADIAPLASLISPLVNAGANISVSYGEVPASSPYVYISDTAPEGTIPKIAFDQGVVELRGSGGNSLVTNEALSGLTIVQILNDGSQSVLWIRPGSDFASLANREENDAITLSYGDVALIGSENVDLAFSTTRDRLVDIHYPERFSFGQFLSDYRLWFIGLGWLLLSAGFIYILRRVYSGRKAPE